MLDPLIVAAVVGAATGALLSVYFDRRQLQTERADRRMHGAFELLVGGTQKRSAGIALLEGKPPRDDWRKATVGLLANQAIYLLEQSKEGQRRDEVRNLQRILCLLYSLTEGEPSVATDRAAVRQSLLWRQSDRKKGRDGVPLGLEIQNFGDLDALVTGRMTYSGGLELWTMDRAGIDPTPSEALPR